MSVTFFRKSKVLLFLFLGLITQGSIKAYGPNFPVVPFAPLNSPTHNPGIPGIENPPGTPVEGMWLPLLLSQLNEADMKARGLKISAEDIYSINKSSLKDAILLFGGCTASVISDQGLMLTNHHCGYSAIQSHSTVENDLLLDGFWAKTKGDELINDGLTATLIVRMEDVTQQILKGVTEGMTEADRRAIVSSNTELVEKAATEGTHYKAQVKPFFYGNEYYMFVTETFTDIRLVAAPPEVIGKFGGDTDNWVWPRHTGDFSIFRIYAGPDNKPADYSPENKPYQPKQHLKISLKGVQKGDFTMVFGFPGRTTEYLTSHAVEDIYTKRNPANIKIREKRMEIMDKYMTESDENRLQYSSKYNNVSNYWKKWIGENRGLKNLDAVNRKIEMEAEFTKWVSQSPDRLKTYGNILPRMKELYAAREPYGIAIDYVNEAAFGIEAVLYAYYLSGLVTASKAEDFSDEKLQTEIERAKRTTTTHFKDYLAPLDRETMEAMLKVYLTDIAPEMQPDIFETIRTKYKGDAGAFSDYVFSKSILVSKGKMEEFLYHYKATDVKKLEKDPGYQIMESVLNHYRNKVRESYNKIGEETDMLYRLYVKGLQEMQPNKTFYPDANSTLRLAYGQVDDYVPMDGVFYTPFTTVDGIMEKYNPNHDDFKLKGRIIKMIKEKDFGRYGKDGTLKVCFIASNHTTGGNSGSPVLNGNGELVGLNFDRTWEGTMSDIMYDPNRSRNIAVDIGYVMWVIDKYAGASHLVKELTVIE